MPWGRPRNDRPRYPEDFEAIVAALEDPLIGEDPVQFPRQGATALSRTHIEGNGSEPVAQNARCFGLDRDVGGWHRIAVSTGSLGGTNPGRGPSDDRPGGTPVVNQHRPGKTYHVG